MELHSVLERIGLNKAESKTYLALLTLGHCKASQVAIKEGLNRGAVYYALQSLKEKGFVSQIIKSGVAHYSAAPPARLLELVEEENKKKLATLQGSLAELKGMHVGMVTSPIVEIYEGYEGFKTSFDLLLESAKSEILCLMSPDVLRYLPHFHIQFRKRRAEKKISIRTITERTAQLERIRSLDKKELRQTRFSKRPIFKGTDLLLYITHDAILTIRSSSKQQIGIYIKDESLAAIHRNIFEDIWSTSS